MSVQQVIVPNNMNTLMSFEQEVSTYLSSGADVQFVDDSGKECNISYIGIFGGSDGAIKSRVVGQIDAQAKTRTYAYGGFMAVPMSYIYASGTDTGLVLIVRAKLPQ